MLWLLSCNFTSLTRFIFTIAADPVRVILLMLSAFFWLLSLFLSSILWFAVVPLKETLAFGLVFSVLFQVSIIFFCCCVFNFFYLEFICQCFLQH